MPIITIVPERTCHWTRTRRRRAPSSHAVAYWLCQFWADCTTDTSGFSFRHESDCAAAKSANFTLEDAQLIMRIAIASCVALRGRANSLMLGAPCAPRIEKCAEDLFVSGIAHLANGRPNFRNVCRRLALTLNQRAIVCERVVGLGHRARQAEQALSP